MSLIIDTDIGSDVDDTLAITYAIKAGIYVPLITTVHGDTVLRANIAKKVTELLGENIRVASGQSEPLKQTHIFWTGHEGKGFVDDVNRVISLDAVDALAGTIRAYSENGGHISIAALGPLTNVALAFFRYPDLPSRLQTVYIMGNAIVEDGRYFLNYRAHNFKVDPEAIDIVMAANVKKILVTTEAGKQATLSLTDIDGMALHPDLKKYLRNHAESGMRHFGYSCANLYDPFTVHQHISREDSVLKNYGRISIATHALPSFKEVFIKKMNGGIPWTP